MNAAIRALYADLTWTKSKIDSYIMLLDPNEWIDDFVSIEILLCRSLIDS